MTQSIQSAVAIGVWSVVIISARPDVRVVTILQPAPFPPGTTNSPVISIPRVICIRLVIPIWLIIAIIIYALHEIRFVVSRSKTG